MKVIGTTRKLSLDEALRCIEIARKDFKVGAIFQHNGLWHAVHDDGPESVRIICVRVNPDRTVEGVNPFALEDRDRFFDSLNNAAFDSHGRRLKTQLERERELGRLPSDDYQQELNGKKLVAKLLS